MGHFFYKYYQNKTNKHILTIKKKYRSTFHYIINFIKKINKCTINERYE